MANHKVEINGKQVAFGLHQTEDKIIDIETGEVYFDPSSKPDKALADIQNMESLREVWQDLIVEMISRKAR